MKKLLEITILIIVIVSSTSLVAQSYSGGSGTSGDPYKIGNKADLKYLSEHSGEWSKHFIQTVDIEFSNSDFQIGGDFYNSGNGFIPIGNINNVFTGYYNGDNHTIDGVYINRVSTVRVGFFGRTGTPGSITNLGLLNVDITGDATGGLVGHCYNTISNCYTTGSVSGKGQVGGLCGLIQGPAISNCYSMASVTSTSSDNGGFAGVANTDITNCYSTGSVAGPYNTGGFVGRVSSSETVSNSYSLGDGTRNGGSTDANIGGFCGENDETGTIDNCYSKGNVIYSNATDPNDKGFCGNSDGTLTDNFFDSDVSNQTSGNGATAKTTTQMTTQSTFTNSGWDFSTTWALSGSINNGYPYLQSNPPMVVTTPTTQATNIVFSEVYSSQMSISWTVGNGSNRLVFMKEASSGNAGPSDGTTYMANSNFGSGTQIGSTGWYCIYNGLGTNVTAKGLSASTTYQLHVCDYNGVGGTSKYITTSSTNNPKSQSSNELVTPPNALSFDGSSDYVKVKDPGDLNMYKSSFTLEMWIKSSSSHAGWVVPMEYGNEWEPGAYGFHSENATTMKVDFYYCPVEAELTGTDWTDGKWHHFAGVFDNDNDKLILYYDGIKVDEVAVTAEPEYLSDNLYIASRGGLSLFTEAEIDEIRIWNIARSETQIQENMCNTLVGNESGLVAYYKCDESAGTSLPDESSNSNTGSLENMDAADWVGSEAFTTWDGSESSSWSTSENWTNGNPDLNDNVGITSNGTAPTISSLAACNNLVVKDGATLTFDNSGSHTIHGNVFNIGTTNIKANNELTITGSLYMLHHSYLNIRPLASLTIGTNLYTRILGLDGTLTIDSDNTGTGSLIVNGTATGDITVERFLTADKWHYISGQSDITNNFTVTMGFPDPGSQTASSFYRWDESFVTNETPGTWIDILNGPDGDGTDHEMNQTFVAGRGYAVTYASTDKTLSLTGAPYLEDKTITITNTTLSTNPGSNLVGNPFCSDIAINSIAHLTNNFITQNASLLHDNAQAVYFWGDTQEDYVTKNNTGDAVYTEPGQGFMIIAKNATAELQLNTAIRKHGTSTFYKNNQDTENLFIELLAVDNENRINTTNVSFILGMTVGLDPSYDAMKLKGNPNISLYTRLVEDNGADFAIQALNDMNIENYIIPVGIDVAEETIIDFSISQTNLDQNIYLEDRLLNTSTNLSIETYSANINESGIGRFFLHFAPVGINETENIADPIQLYSHGNTITIINNNNLGGMVHVTNILGMEVANFKLNGNNTQKYALIVSAGVYIVYTVIENGNIFSEKIIIK